MTLRKKLITGYLLLGSFLAVQAGVSFYFNDEAKELADQAIETNFEASLRLSDLTILAQKMRRYEKEAFIYVAAADRRDRYIDAWGRAFGSSTESLEQMIANQDGIYSPEDVLAMQRWRDGLSKYGWEFRKIAEKMAEPKFLKDKPETTANEMIRAGKEQLAPLLREAPWMGKRKREHAQQLRGQIESNYHTAEVIYMVITVLGLLVTGIIVFGLPGQIAGTLQTLIEKTERMSLGNLSEKIELTTVPEFDRLARALQRIQATNGALLERLQRRGQSTERS